MGQVCARCKTEVLFRWIDPNQEVISLPIDQESSDVTSDLVEFDCFYFDRFKQSVCFERNGPLLQKSRFSKEVVEELLAFLKVALVKRHVSHERGHLHTAVSGADNLAIIEGQ